MSAHARGLVIAFHVLPNAPRTEVQGEHGGALKLRLAAPPVDGKANEALVKWLSKQLGVSRASIELLAGDKDRRKRVLVTATLGAEAIERALIPAERRA